jgi:hypothetical protein
MASDARWGLKLIYRTPARSLYIFVGRATEARWGLKPPSYGASSGTFYTVGRATEARWGLKQFPLDITSIFVMLLGEPGNILLCQVYLWKEFRSWPTCCCSWILAYSNWGVLKSTTTSSSLPQPLAPSLQFLLTQANCENK